MRLGVLFLTLCFSVVSLNGPVLACNVPVSQGIKVSSVIKGNKVMLRFEEEYQEKVHVSLYDSAGTLLCAKDLKQHQKSMEFGELEAGAYWFSIKKQAKVALERVVIPSVSERS